MRAARVPALWPLCALAVTGSREERTQAVPVVSGSSTYPCTS
jgi:hypothetical protein